jgi:hypothetical protein
MRSGDTTSATCSALHVRVTARMRTRRRAADKSFPIEAPARRSVGWLLFCRSSAFSFQMSSALARRRRTASTANPVEDALRAGAKPGRNERSGFEVGTGAADSARDGCDAPPCEAPRGRPGEPRRGDLARGFSGLMDSESDERKRSSSASAPEPPAARPSKACIAGCTADCTTGCADVSAAGCATG